MTAKKNTRILGQQVVEVEATKARKRSSKKAPAAPQATAATIAVPASAVPKAAKNLAASTVSKPTKPTRPPKVVHPKAKMTFRRNVLPPILGVLMFLGVLGLLNAQWLIAQYQFRYAKPAPATAYSATPATTDPNAPAHIYIPGIEVSAPIVTDVKTYDAASVQLGLRRGPVQFGASVDPGQKGNIVIVGHSSGQLWAPGDYKFVFTLLDKMAINDRILIDFKGKRYIYRVSTSKVVAPTDISVLQPADPNQPELTLITCTPVGTSKNRRVITARQVSPNPDTAVAAPTVKSVTATAIPN